MQIQFALSPFRSPLIRESPLIYFPAATKMFQFTAFPLRKEQVAETTYEVTLGNLGLKDCMRLAQAYRSLPRPSSASRTELFATWHGSNSDSGTSLIRAQAGTVH